jgi:DNA (cytosine-5)-methyltransferase 1
LTPIESERIQGFPDDWTLPVKFDEDSEKIESKRYHAAGNAVTVNVAEWLARRIRAAIQERAAHLAPALPKKPSKKRAYRSDVNSELFV